MNLQLAARTILTLEMALLASCHRPDAGNAQACPYSDAGYSRQIGAAGDWSELYALYQSNSNRCPLTNAQAKYSRRLVQLLGEKWQDLPQIEQSMQLEAPITSFLYEHVNRDAEAANLKLLLSNARTQCPQNANALCEQLAWRAQAALIAQGVTN